MTPSDDWGDLVAQLESEMGHRSEESGAAADGAWEELRRRLRSMARLLAASGDADDVVQTVLLKLQSPDALRRLRAAGSPEGYAVMMVRNAAVDAVRRRAAAMEIKEVEEVVVLEWPDEVLGRQEQQASVAGVLETLEESDRWLLTLRFWEDLSIAEIARRLRMPYSTVAVRLFRLLRRLRSQLGSSMELYTDE